jgi:alpha-galactosidase
MAAHVTRWGDRPLDFACAVALSGRFGIDLDLTAITPDEEAVLRRAVALARRTQPLVQQGVLERLVSPVEGSDRSRAALAYRSTDGSRAVVFAYQLEESTSVAGSVSLPWLEPSGSYQVLATDLDDPDPVLTTVPGHELATVGLPWPDGAPLTARVWELVGRS